MDLAEEEDTLNGDMMIYDINPEQFRSLKYMIFIGADMMEEKSEIFEKAMNLEAYDRLIQSPVISQDPDAMRAVTRDFLIESFAKGESDKYMPKAQPLAPAGPMPEDAGAESVMAGNTNQFTQKGVNSNLLQQITGSGSIKKMNK